MNDPLIDDDSPFDLRHAARWLGFGFRSLRRHALVAVGVFFCVVGGTVLALRVLPRSYRTEAKILAQRNLIMGALGNPKRAIPTEADSPIKFATETLLKRDNIVAMVRQTNLIDEWAGSRAPILRVKDALLERLNGKPTGEDKLESLIGLVRKRLDIKVDEGSVTIGIDWPEPNMAYRLVNTAQENFLETRHAQEISVIAETIAIIEGHAAHVLEGIDQIVEELNRAKKHEDSSLQSAQIKKRATFRRAYDSDAAQIGVMLAAKRKAISDLEQFRQRRMSELQALLSEQRNEYGPSHPAIANTMQNLQALQDDSPQLATLRREDKELSRELGRHGDSSGAVATSREVAADMEPLPVEVARARTFEPGKDREEDENVAYARARLKLALSSYEDLVDRIGAARIELDTARAAFKYRYSVMQPAQVPKFQEKPNVLFWLVASVIGGVLLSVATALALDLVPQRVVEAWQIESVLAAPLLATLSRP